VKERCQYRVLAGLLNGSHRVVCFPLSFGKVVTERIAQWIVLGGRHLLCWESRGGFWQIRKGCEEINEIGWSTTCPRVIQQAESLVSTIFRDLLQADVFASSLRARRNQMEPAVYETTRPTWKARKKRKNAICLPPTLSHQRPRTGEYLSSSYARGDKDRVPSLIGGKQNEQ